jgi:CO/xanthine dehydrogenase Mo-binding subunit
VAHRTEGLAPQRDDAPRVDSWDKITGAAAYVEDLPEPPGTVFAVPLQSPYAHARIRSVDATRARALPGVLGVLDRTNLHEFDLRLDGLNPLDPDLIVTDKALFQGDLLAVVVANDLRTARHAVGLIDVDYETLPPLFTAEAALAPGAPILHEHLGTNAIFEDSFAWGNVEEGFSQADEIFEDVINSPTVFHHPMEPIGTGLVRWTGDGVEIWAPSNTPMRDAAGVARVLGIRPERVRLQVPTVGGGFGAKKVTREMVAALALSRKLDRPIKLVATDEQSFAVAVRHAMEFRSRAGVMRDGRIVALDVDLLVDCGAYFTGGRTATHNACISAWGCYKLPNFRVRAQTAFTNKTPATPHRGTGKTQTVFSVECVIDRIAHRLGIDPVELRNRNLLQPGDRIADVWEVRGEPAPVHIPPIDVDIPALMQQAVGMLGPMDGAAPNGSGARIVRGRGVALSLRHGSKGETESQAAAELASDGTVTISHNAADLGQGIYNMIGIVASRTLGMRQDQVRVAQPDTSNMLAFAGASAQRTTVEMGNAVHAACTNLKRQLVDLAAETRGGDPNDWRLEDGKLRRGSESFELTEFIAAGGGITLRATGADEETYPHDQAFGLFEHWAPGVAAAEVEVDLDTGEVRPLQYTVLADAGTVLHYNSARGQLEGGAVMGFGLALFEEMRYEEGQLQNADAFQYRLPLLRDMPPVMQTTIMESGEGPGPFGARGIAQTSIPCVAPAVANAIHAAIGAPIGSTPITPEKVLRALGRLDGEA